MSLPGLRLTVGPSPPKRARLRGVQTTRPLGEILLGLGVLGLGEPGVGAGAGEKKAILFLAPLDPDIDTGAAAFRTLRGEGEWLEHGSMIYCPAMDTTRRLQEESLEPTEGPHCGKPLESSTAGEQWHRARGERSCERCLESARMYRGVVMQPGQTRRNRSTDKTRLRMWRNAKVAFAYGQFHLVVPMEIKEKIDALSAELNVSRSLLCAELVRFGIEHGEARVIRKPVTREITIEGKTWRCDDVDLSLEVCVR